jgi:hypothetical protein
MALFGSNRKSSASLLFLSLCMLLVSNSFVTVMLVDGARVRGEGKAAETTENTRDTSMDGRRQQQVPSRGSSAQRRLFADKWGDPSNPGRGGAAAKAKGFQEVILMMQRFPSPAPQPPTPSIPPTGGRNDRCTNALGPIDVSPASNAPILYDDNTVGAMIPMVLPDRCDRISNSSPGVWYQVLGTGSSMTASLCHAGTNFDSKITVYQGDCNGVLACVTANDDSASICSLNRQASQVQWDSETDVTYYVLIHGFGARVGEFQLSVETQ